MSPQAGTGRPLGLLLVRGPEPMALRWAARGMVAAAVTELGDWSALTLADPIARTAKPYDMAVQVILARPVAMRLRPAIGLFESEGMAVVTAQPRALRATTRWRVWSPTDGVVDTPRLPPLRPDDLARAAGTGVATSAVAAALREPAATPVAWLTGILAALRLPGESLLRDGPSPEATLVEPSDRQVRAFDALAADELAHRLEMEGP